MKPNSPIIVCLLMINLVWTASDAQTEHDTAAIQKIIQEETIAWNKGDAKAYSTYFAADGTFTNVLGMFFNGKKAFEERHDQTFKSIFRGSTKQEDIVSLRLIRPDVAIVETLQTVTGFQSLPPGTSADNKGRLRTRLLQVLVKDHGRWKIEVYHNVDVKAGVTVPEPR